MTRRSDAGDDGEQPKPLLTVDQLAERWNVHPRTIRRMIKKQKIPVIRIEGCVRIHPSVAELGPGDTF